MKRFNGTFAEWLLSHVLVTDMGHDTPCWLWQGHITEKGYARTCIPRAFGAEPRRQRVHRFAFKMLKGEVPEELHLDHLCRVKHCCNPDHLEPVSAAENNRRVPSEVRAVASAKACEMLRKRAQLAGRPYLGGKNCHHAKSPEDLNAAGKCRLCRNEYMRAWGQRHPGYRQRYPHRKAS